jgi:SagB-type dehydrogenase family enzyme
MINDKNQEIGTATLPEAIILMEPKWDDGKTVLQALHERQTIREISDEKLPLQELSNLLWAASGVNRKEGPFGSSGRTSASASNSQEIDIYAAFEEGVYIYDAYNHKLVPVVAGDLRTFAVGQGQKGFGCQAPIRLIYVADIDKLENTSGFKEPGLQNPEVQKSYYFIDTGIIAGNVYLYAVSQGLASWFHNCDRKALEAKLNLRQDQRILFGHTVGYPVKK